MPKLPRLQLALFAFASLSFAGTAFAADPLDFPGAIFRIKVGPQVLTVRANDAGTDLKIDGHVATTGERLSNTLRINWIIAPCEGIGDEYVFIVKRGKEKARAYPVVFKGGFVSVLSANDLLIEIEN